jgi:hypothetical protein
MKSIIGVNNPYGLIQKAGKRKTHRRHKKNKNTRRRKTRKYN